MICFAEAGLSGQIGPVLSQVFVYIDIFQRFIFLTFGFDIFFGPKDSLSDIAGGEFHKNLTWFSCDCLADSV